MNMEGNLITYLSRRMQKESYLEKGIHSPGPVITISREVGCNGLKLAKELARSLNEEKLIEWKVLSKEIFYESARELNLDPEHVRKIFKQPDRYTFDEILNAFSYKQFKSERKIIRTVTDVVHSFAIDGFCIIVGRAGNIIAKGIVNSIHIKLFAPIEFRVMNVMENNPFSRQEAIEFINRIENERNAFRKLVSKEKGEENLNEFDLIINRSSFTTKAIVDMIVEAVKGKNILYDFKRNTENF